MGQRNAEDFLHESAVLESIRTQLRPVFPLAAFDHVVKSGQCVSPVIQMAVQHSLSFLEESNSGIRNATGPALKKLILVSCLNIVP